MEEENVIKEIFVQEFGWLEVTEHPDTARKTYKKIEYFDDRGTIGYKCIGHDGTFMSINPRYVVAIKFDPSTLEDSMKE